MPTLADARSVTPQRALALLLIVALVAACGGAGTGSVASSGSVAPTRGAGTEIVVHRSATCGCCAGWEDEMVAAGFAVRAEVHADMEAVKAAFGVPPAEQSCHTSEVGGYVVEGHVPAAALRDLLAQRPAVDGITLAGMPAGSPGMPGEQVEPFVVHTIADGAVTGVFGEY